MAIVGAILGDIAGSQFEFEECRPFSGVDAYNCSLFTDRCVFTDDTVLTLAVKKAICNKQDFANTFREMATHYKFVGYGTGFHKWLYTNSRLPFNSCGNGSAMRISYIADTFENRTEMEEITKKSAICTHNHPEGIKGAIVAANCMWMAKHNASRLEIMEYAIKQYPKKCYEFGCDRPIAEYSGYYRFDATCQGSVPVAIRCFLESDCYENCLRIAFGLHCDLDTVCCIAGGIAENFYKETGFDNENLLKRYLDSNLLNLLNNI